MRQGEASGGQRLAWAGLAGVDILAAWRGQPSRCVPC